MKVLHIINRLPGHGGAEVSLRDFLIADASDIHHAIVLLAGDGNVLEPFEDAGITCYVPSRSVLSRLQQLRHVRASVRTFQPDLIHTTLFEADVAGRVAGFLEGVPTVTSIVNTSYAPEVMATETANARKLKAVRLIDRILARHLNSGLHAISHATADHAVEYLKVPRERIRVVPRGRSHASLGQPSRERRDAVRDRLVWESRPIVINVARQEPQKGHRYLIEAFAAVLESHDDALLVLVGRAGRSTADLNARIAEFGIEASVVRLGVRTDVADLVSAADVFAFPSLYEGLGGAAVEALGLGTPIVTSDVPALRELVGGDRGWLVPPGDPIALASALREVLAGGDEVQRRSRAARQAFLDYYELDACVQAMVSFYRDVGDQLSERPQSRFRRPPRLNLAEVPPGSQR